jgi:hypothetical protein
VRSSSGCDERLDVLAAEVPATVGIVPFRQERGEERRAVGVGADRARRQVGCL